ncbi:MAG: PhaM family polyhydroxyalkanoate granule multifunctional regulatory protein [Burkholderiaceae bacterium]
MPASLERTLIAMADHPAPQQMAPGFDFLQDLIKNAGAALPHIGQWVAPTLNPEEIGKRIQELRTVQFWLEQNARMLGATIQALEVQRMTLTTLQTMNVKMGDLRESLSLRTEPPGHATKRSAVAESKPGSAGPARESTRGNAPSAAGVDPMQWWGALTQQFAELAATAVKDSAAHATGNAAGAEPGLDEVGQTPNKTTTASAPRRAAAAPRRKPVAKGTSVNPR